MSTGRSGSKTPYSAGGAGGGGSTGAMLRLRRAARFASRSSGDSEAPPGSDDGLGRAGHGVLLGRCPTDDGRVRHAGLVVDDVGDHHGHVVGGAGVQGQRDETFGSLIGVRNGEGLGDGVHGHVAREPVAAQQVAVAAPGLADRQIGLHARPAVERLGEQ